MGQEETVDPLLYQVHQPPATSVTLKKILGYFGEELLMNGKMYAKRRKSKLRYSYSLLKFFLLSQRVSGVNQQRIKNQIQVLSSYCNKEMPFICFHLFVSIVVLICGHQLLQRSPNCRDIQGKVILEIKFCHLIDSEMKL